MLRVIRYICGVRILVNCCNVDSLFVLLVLVFGNVVKNISFYNVNVSVFIVV